MKNHTVLLVIVSVWEIITWDRFVHADSGNSVGTNQHTCQHIIQVIRNV